MSRRDRAIDAIGRIGDAVANMLSTMALASDPTLIKASPARFLREEVYRPENILWRDAYMKLRDYYDYELKKARSMVNSLSEMTSTAIDKMEQNFNNISRLLKRLEPLVAERKEAERISERLENIEKNLNMIMQFIATSILQGGFGGMGGMPQAPVQAPQPTAQPTAPAQAPAPQQQAQRQQAPAPAVREERRVQPPAQQLVQQPPTPSQHAPLPQYPPEEYYARMTGYGLSPTQMRMMEEAGMPPYMPPAPPMTPPYTVRPPVYPPVPPEGGRREGLWERIKRIFWRRYR